jgi:hypothetical protein
LAIIAFVMRDLARDEIGRIRYPDIALPFAVEHPPHARRMRCACQTVRKWRTEHLLDGERPTTAWQENRNDSGTAKQNFHGGATLLALGCAVDFICLLALLFEVS